MALMQNGGDPFKATKALCNSDTLKNMAIATVTAGALEYVDASILNAGSSAASTTGTATQGASTALAASSEATSTVAQTASLASSGVDVMQEVMTFAHQAKEAVAHAVVGATIQTAFGEKNAFKNFAQTALSSAVMRYTGGKIVGAQLEGLTEKLAHAASGAAFGYVADGEKGATSGAIGAFVAASVTSTAHEAGLEAKTAHKLGAIASALPAFWNEYTIGIGSTAGMNAASAVKDGIVNRLKAEAERQALAQQEAQRQAAENLKEKAAEEQTARAEQHNQDGAAKKAKVRKMTPQQRAAAEAVDVQGFTQENYFGAEDAEISHLFAKTKQAEALVAESSGCLQRPDSPITQLLKEIYSEISEIETQNRVDLQRMNISAIQLRQTRYDDLYEQKRSLESSLPGRQAFRECRDGDYIRGGVRAVEFGASFVPSGASTVASLGAGALGTHIDFERGVITESEYREQLMVLSVTGAASLPRGPKAFKNFTTKFSHKADYVGRVTHDFMQRAAALNRPQRVLVSVNSGAPQAFMVGYKPATKPMPTFSSMKAQGTGGIVNRGSAPSATASTAPAARQAARPQPAGQAENKISSVQDIVSSKSLLSVEGKVDKFRELKKLDKPGDNLAAHHMPNDQYMRTKNVSRGDGIAMMVEHPTPGNGGRHREIHKELQRQNHELAPRDALAQAVSRAKTVYQAEGVYTNKIRKSLQEVIKKNKEIHPQLFAQE